ncbi:adenosylmethionine decarboxylase [Prochlorococcus sp. MIT 1307]|uniref:adenosylmethionine decarboxylase n=1 Tax=Prochlorococcus sp. MIT 1307 TaxID=3096219 RepID=UPI002A753715|nr:adenosylmethionine decarboxylase [Prochlorococcus sp. MIT 1307]
MEHILPCLHPNPGWIDSDIVHTPGTVTTSAAEVVGKHCILELYECDTARLNDEAFLRTTITTSAKMSGATLLNLITHRFEPQGVTGLALLAESHISIHTWPENGYAAVDVFTCGDHTMPEKACEILRQEFLARRFSLKSFQREIPDTLSNTLRRPHSVKQVSR